MVRAIAVLPPDGGAVEKTGDTVTLDRESRYRRRVSMVTDQGQRFLLDLPDATYLPDGCKLVLETGGKVRVLAAAEPLLELTARDPLAMTRIAWHIGNRHTPCEVTSNALYIQPDHVLAEMVEGLGGKVRRVTRAFEPEGGAYGGKGPLSKGHHHAHGSHDHGPHDHGKHGHGSHHARDTQSAAAPAVWRPDGG